MVSKINIKSSFQKLVRKSSNIVITSHYSPDDDAIGSSLATFNWLTTKFPHKNIRIIITGSYVSRYSEFYNYHQIKFVSDLSTELEDIDLLIMLDGSQYSRFTRTPNSIASSQFLKVCFDHHSSPIDKFDLIYLDKTATSTSEIILDTLYKNIKFGKPIAELFLMGIFGDTGTINYLKPNQLNTLDNLKKLLKITQTEIQEFKSTYSSITFPAFTIIQEFMRNTQFMDLHSGHNYQYTFVTPEFINQNDFSDGQISEAAHIYMSQYLRIIENYQWGFIATPKRDEISVSFRSLPKSVNVRALVEKIDIGGGHDRAAGSSFKADKWGKKLNLQFAIKYLVEWIATHDLELS
ncbi:MAG: DHH family phosphoesterase [Microgenomates group bacterium]